MAERSDRHKTFYEILGVPSTADRGQIESAYRSLVRKYHPDTHPDDALADAEFKKATEAYETLGDPERRRQYDRQHTRASRNSPSTSGEAMHWTTSFAGPSGGLGGAPPPWQGLADLVDHWFSVAGIAPRPGFGSAGPATSEKQPAPGPSGTRARGRRDMEAELMLTPEEARRGGPCEFTLSLAEACPECLGPPTSTCGNCGGTGSVARRLPVQVHLPSGLASGEVLRLPGKGKPARAGEPAGDLYLRIRVRPCW
jgi:DnaJ-class molecular chaperone